MMLESRFPKSGRPIDTRLRVRLVDDEGRYLRFDGRGTVNGPMWSWFGTRAQAEALRRRTEGPWPYHIEEDVRREAAT